MNNPKRQTEVTRATKETTIFIALDLDGSGKAEIDTGIPFLDHMLTLLTVHSLCNLTVKAEGDLKVDDHHTVEDVGLVLGAAFKECLGEKKGIIRYGEATIPMDETLVRVALDLSGRPFLSYNLELPYEVIGGMAVENIHEFMRALVNTVGMNLHLDVLRGINTHHMIEATYKALGRSLKMAIAYEPRIESVWSSKGTL